MLLKLRAGTVLENYTSAKELGAYLLLALVGVLGKEFEFGSFEFKL